MKQCKKCLQFKPKIDFCKEARNRDGLRSICKKCWNKISRQYLKEIKDKYGLGAGTILRYGFRLALKIYEKFDRKCSMCGSKDDLTIHHLDRKGRNYTNKGLKPNNSEDNLIVVCRRCHGSIHGKESWSKRKKKMED